MIINSPLVPFVIYTCLRDEGFKTLVIGPQRDRGATSLKMVLKLCLIFAGVIIHI